MINIFNYIEKDSPVHKLSGASKFAAVVLTVLAVMTTFNTPFLLVLLVLSLVLFRISKIRFKDVKVLVILTMIFVVLNLIMIYLFAPEHGCTIYGTRHVLAGKGYFVICAEQLLYEANVLLKNLVSIPIVLLFITTTHPSEFAASLNKVGVSYRIAYSVALALRYIPDLINDFRDVAQGQQARGIEMSGKETLIKRLRAATTLVIPLILSSIEKIDVISNAMELRGFGKRDKRTWIMAQKFKVADYLTIAAAILLLAFSVGYTILNGSRYWNPFV